MIGSWKIAVKWKLKNSHSTLIYKNVIVNSYGGTIPNKEDQTITSGSRVGRQSAHCQDDPEVLVGKNNHFIELTNLINIHSDMRLKISNQKRQGVEEEEERNLSEGSYWNCNYVEGYINNIGKVGTDICTWVCINLYINLFIDSYLINNGIHSFVPTLGTYSLVGWIAKFFSMQLIWGPYGEV